MRLENGNYYVQNQKLIDLANAYGTPLYVYDGQKIEEQISKMKAAFPDVDLKIKYACKALTNTAILKLMRKNGVEVDVVSIEEATIAIKAGYSGKQIQYTPSGVHFSEIEKAIELGLKLNLDSLQVIEQFGQKYGNSFPICLRVNPSLMEGGNIKISTGHADSKFGIPFQQFDKVYELVEKYNINIIGLHQHTGSDFKNAKVIVKAAKVLFEIAYIHFPNLEFIDLGSGFKVAYSENDHITDMDDLGRDVVKEFKHFVEKYGKPVQLWFEPGKYLVSESGYLLTNVNVVKHNPTKNFLCVDSGLNHLIRPMMYDAFHDIINISSKSEEKEVYDVVGYICETDTLGSKRELPKAVAGDILCIKNAGAYGFSMASNYNSRVRPAEVLVYQNEAKLIRRRETTEDILATIVDVEL